MTPHEKLVTVIAACVVVAVVGWLFHWYVLDWRLWWRTLATACRNGMVAFSVARRPANLPGPVNRPLPDGVRADGAGWVRELDTDAWDRLDADQAADLLIAEWRDDSPGRDWDSSRTPAPAAGGHHLGAPFERTITGDIWDQWWEGLDGLNRECLLVTAWVGRESAAWAELVAETRELCAA